MSKILGVISEFNPFHNGHLYHLKESKKQTNCDYSINILNGNFTQRGMPSIVNKWYKAQMALNNGFDLVIELPTIYGISSAENFADGSVKILNCLDIVDILSFGSEIGNLDKLHDVSNLLCNEPEEYSNILKKELASGNSFPKARETAVIQYLGKKYENILNSPNNILAIEYLKSLKKHNSNIIPFTIKRKDSEHLSFTINSAFASSTLIRNLLKSNKLLEVRNVIPEKSYSILNTAIQKKEIISNIYNFEKIIIYRLRIISKEELNNIPEISESLGNTIKKAAEKYNSIDLILEHCKSKCFTYARLQRIFIYILLNITKSDMDFSKNIIPYIRILGMNSNGKKILSEILKKNPNLPVITSVKDFENKNKNKFLQRLLDIDKIATNIYTLGYENNIAYSNLDYTKKIITI